MDLALKLRDELLARNEDFQSGLNKAFGVKKKVDIDSINRFFP